MSSPGDGSIGEHSGPDVAMMTLRHVNAAPSIASSRPSLLSPLNAAPSLPSSTVNKEAPINTAEASSMAAAAQAASTAALPAAVRTTEAASKADMAVPRALVRNMHGSRVAQPVGSPTMHTFRLPDMTSNVTIATKDAFACVNAMFSSSLSHELCHASKPATFADPTVTISTKAAFAELNQMFSSDLPHRKQHAKAVQHTALPRPAARRAIGKRSTSERPVDHGNGPRVRSNAAAAGPAQPAQAEVTGSLGVYQDTCTLQSPKAAAKGASSDFAIYEDTNFFGPHSHAEQPASSPAANQLAACFQIYEDTQCIQDKPGLQHEPTKGRDASPVFGMHEDTGLPNTSPKAAARNGASPAGLGIREDTQFVAAHAPHRATAVQQHGSQQGELGMYEDTQFINKSGQDQGVVDSSPGGLGIYEDTQFIKSDNSGHAALGHQAVPAADAAEVEDKENLAGPPR